jgi:hypothetical protein
MANLLLYSYNPGEFVQYISACGEVHIGRILNVGQHNLTVQRWLPDPNHHSDDIFFPLCFVESLENQVIPIPSMSSLVLMAKKTDINQFLSQICSRDDEDHLYTTTRCNIASPPPIPDLYNI